MYAQGDDRVVDWLAYGIPWEERELAFWGLVAPLAQTVFDIGANTGIYSLLTCAKAPYADVFAFEPHPGNAKRLRHNLRLNTARNARVVDQAVGDQSGPLTLHWPPDGRICPVASVSLGFAEAFAPTAHRPYHVPQTTIDAFVEEQALTSVDLLKIDVESHELAVLRGAEKTLDRYRPTILCEIVDVETLADDRPALKGIRGEGHQRAIAELLSQHRYGCYRITSEGLHPTCDFGAGSRGESNYVFSPVVLERRLIPWSRPDLVKRLLTTFSGD